MGAGMCRISPRLVSYGRVNSDIDLRLGPELPRLFVPYINENTARNPGGVTL